MQKKITVIFIVLLIIAAALILIVQSRGRSQSLLPTSNLGSKDNLAAVGTEESSTKNFMLGVKDTNSTTTMKVGDELLVQLGVKEWTLTITPDGILGIIPNMPTISGVQGIYKALKTGTVTIHGKAAGTGFKATVIVE